MGKLSPEIGREEETPEHLNGSSKIQPAARQKSDHRHTLCSDSSYSLVSRLYRLISPANFPRTACAYTSMEDPCYKATRRVPIKS